MSYLDKWITTSEAATVLQVVPSLVRRWVANGTLKSVLKGGRRYVKRADVDRLATAPRRGGGWPRGVKKDPATGKPDRPAAPS